MNDFKKMLLIEKDRSKYKRYCSYCGHSIVYTPSCKSDKVICTHCRNFIYRNDKIEFEEKLKKAMKNY